MCWRDRSLCCKPRVELTSPEANGQCQELLAWLVCGHPPPLAQALGRTLQSCCSTAGFGSCLDPWGACGTPRAYFWLWTDLPRGRMEGKTQLGWWNGQGGPQDVWEKLAC